MRTVFERWKAACTLNCATTVKGFLSVCLSLSLSLSPSLSLLSWRFHETRGWYINFETMLILRFDQMAVENCSLLLHVVVSVGKDKNSTEQDRRTGVRDRTQALRFAPLSLNTDNRSRFEGVYETVSIGKFTNIAEEFTVSIFRNHIVQWLLGPWKWRQQAPPWCWYILTNRYGVIHRRLESSSTQLCQSQNSQGR